jgi:hypothetical protein
VGRLIVALILKNFVPHGVSGEDTETPDKNPSAGDGGNAKQNAKQQLTWQLFDEKKYIDKTRVREGQDAYEANKFNQA